MNWNLFWSAFSAIGTTVGALITAITVIIAYKQYRLNLFSKLKIKFMIEYIGSTNGITQEYLTFEFINQGAIDIVVEGIYIQGNRKYYSITYLTKLIPNCKEEQLPITITNKRLVSARIPLAEFKYFVKNIMGIDLGYVKKIHFLIIDAKGKRYKKKIWLHI